MHATKVTFAVKNREDLAACFDATCSEVFATSCHLAAGDRDRAEELMIDIYLSLQRAVGGGATVLVDHDWIVSTALRQVLGHQPDGENEALTALERAVLELHLVDGRDIDTVATMLGLTSAEVITSLARYDDHSQFSTDLVADLLQRSELWLDDTTRRRARAAMSRGQRPPRRATAADEPRRPVPVSEPPRQEPPPLSALDDALPPPHRRIIAAVCAVMALIAVGTIWMLPSSESSTTAPEAPGRSTAVDKLPPATTEAPAPVAVATTSSRGVSSASVASAGPAPAGPAPAGPVTEGSLPAGDVRTPVAEPGFVVGDVPRGFASNGASELLGPATAGRFELWAAPGATRTSGRWLALSTIVNTPSRTVILPGASRELIGGNPAVQMASPDGVSVFTVQPVDGGQFSLTGGGYSNDELRQLAAGITLRHGAPALDSALVTLLTGLQTVATAPSQFGDLAAQVTGGARRWTTYVSDDQSRYVTVTTNATTPNDLRTSELLLPATSDTLAATMHGRTFQMGELTLSVSGAPVRTDGVRSESSIRWHVGNETVTVSGNAGLYVLLGAIPSIRRATTAEWAALFQIDALDLPATGSPRLRGDMIRIGRTTFGDSNRWTISMSDDPVGVRFEVLNHSASGIMGEAVFETDPPPPVSEYVSMSCTLVVVAIAQPGNATGVRISVAGSSPVTVPLIAVDGAGLSAAGYAFGDVAPYTVELVDAAGASVGLINR